MVLMSSSSCVTHRKLTYLQFGSNSITSLKTLGDTIKTVTPSSYKVMPYDNLYIRVITPDPQWSQMFNPMPVGEGGGLTVESAALLGYPVDADGFIELPFAGKLEVAGQTLSEIKTKLDSTFNNYVTDAAIAVRMVDNYVSILGEVRLPGRYPITKDRINIFEAISMAGDMTDFGNRHKIQLIRPSRYGPTIKELSLTDRSIITSEYYYIRPNDVIYAPPMKGKFFGMNTFPYMMLLSTITSFALLWNFINTL